jgi:tripartite-type tricarboxylate transporter receptor subunit TctC
MRKAITATAFVAVVALIGLAHAQDYPTHLIKMVHGFPPGGNVDVIARIMAQEMAIGLGQPIVVESRAGAAGSIAAEAVAHAPPDGYTLFVAASAHAVTGAIYPSLKYRPLDDFTWVSTVSFYPFVICVRTDSHFHTLAELLTAARAKDEAVSYGSSGGGSIQHMTAELLMSATHVRFLHVRYRGEVQSATGLLTGDIDFLISTVTAAMPHIESGEFRALAVTGRTRSDKLLDIPTVAEAGVPGFEITSWTGLAVATGTPNDIVQRLNAEVRRAIAVPQVKSRLESLGGDVRAMSPDEMRALVASQLALWSRVAHEANIRME